MVRYRPEEGRERPSEGDQMAKGGSAKRAATNRGKAALAVGKPPYGGPKGVGAIPKPKVAGPPAKAPPITGPMSGLRPGAKSRKGY